MRIVLIAGVLLLPAAAGAEDLPHHQVPTSPDGNLVVGLCDGETSMEVKGVRDGETLSPEKAQAVADALMDEWKRKHPDRVWVAAEKSPGKPASTAPEAPRRPPLLPPSGFTPARSDVTTTELAGGGAESAKGERSVQSGHTYGSFSARDVEVWNAATQALVERGNVIFHSGSELGSTSGMACDMCHPNAANTHPETYPKFQVQLGRVAMLRDMINWCIENPVRGHPFADDSQEIRALEAYILASRKGVPLQYGKH